MGITFGIAGHSLGEERPNVVLIMADDMGWSDLGCYGGEIKTPSIDRLAAEGIQFLQFYNNAKCTTTRASLLTGLYPRNGGRGIELLNANMMTLGEALSDAGYVTGLSGKWHNGSSAPHRPSDRGFEESYGLWDGGSNFFNPSQPDPKFKGGRTRVFGQNEERITEFPEDFYITEAFTDHAVETIRKHARSGKPFFHYLAYTAPHYPLHAPPEDIARYRGQYAMGWDRLRERRLERQRQMGLIHEQQYPESGPNPGNISWESIDPAHRDWEEARMEVYAAMVDRMDREIGRVLRALDELGIADNTVVLFLSDNGACAEQPGGRNPEQVPGPKEFYTHCGPDWAYAQNTPFRRYKSHTFEGGVATPLVVRWPNGIEPGKRTQQVGHIIDLLPTFLELAGGEYPQSRNGKPLLQEEGISLVPVLRGDAAELERPAPLFWFWSGHRGMREGDWKLVWEKGKEKKWKLFDLKTDRTETVNVADENPGQVYRMSEKWFAWAELTGVKY